MAEERWYEFTQRETFDRPFYVQAKTLEAARKQVRENGAATEGVSDYSPPNPTDFEIIGPGRWFPDGEYVEDLERGRE